MDPKLTFKPIELLDVGIDKLTKIPVPILIDNMISTFDNDDGVPVDSFNIVFDSNYSSGYLTITLTSTYPTNLTFDFDDGYTPTLLISGDTVVQNYYATSGKYSVNVFGDLNKITRMFINPSGTTVGGLVSASLNNLKKLSYLDLSDNLLSQLNIEGMIYLNNIILKNNYIYNNYIDDLYNTSDMIPLFNGTIDTTGTNNGTPSVYSLEARNNLIFKGWSLNYNT